MRLIDADLFMENVRKELDCDGICGSCENDNLCEIFSMVFYQPTAYDVDKVVKQLEERVENFKSLNSCSEIVDVAIKEIQRDIEIVKSGMKDTAGLRKAWNVITEDTDSYPECYQQVLVEDEYGDNNVAYCDADCIWYISNGENTLRLISEVVRWKEL